MSANVAKVGICRACDEPRILESDGVCTGCHPSEDRGEPVNYNPTSAATSTIRLDIDAETISGTYEPEFATVRIDGETHRARVVQGSGGARFTFEPPVVLPDGARAIEVTWIPDASNEPVRAAVMSDRTYPFDAHVSAQDRLAASARKVVAGEGLAPLDYPTPTPEHTRESFAAALRNELATLDKLVDYAPASVDATVIDLLRSARKRVEGALDACEGMAV